MEHDYDNLYRTTPDALGAPTPALTDAFTALLTRRTRVLDIGCGQGRNAIWLAKAGHSVHGIDIAPHGIRDLIGVAVMEGLDIGAQVEDLVTFRPEEKYGALLFDGALRMVADEATRHAALRRYLGFVNPGGFLFVADEAGNVDGLRACLPGDWDVLDSPDGCLFARRHGAD